MARSGNPTHPSPAGGIAPTVAGVEAAAEQPPLPTPTVPIDHPHRSTLRAISMPGRCDQDDPSERLRPLPAFGSGTDVSAGSPSADQPRLLLVERDAAMRVMLTTMLSTHYRVEAVADSLEACQAAKRQPPALIITDLYIPGTDNLTLIRAMRADERTAYMPIIVLTASMHKDLLLRCLAAGASNFLLKPFNTAELLMCARIEMQLRGTHPELG